MSLRNKRLISLKEIEGLLSPHERFIKMEIERRKGALEYVDDVSKLAEYLGGRVETLGLGEDWAMKKEIFPGIEILFIYNHSDEEFESSLRVLYSGQRIRKITGEELAQLTITCVNHMLRYVKETVDKPPEICLKV